MSILEKNSLNKGKEMAISVQGVSKTFKIPHEKISSLRGAFVNSFSGFSRLNLKSGKGSTLGRKNYEEFKALDDVSFEVQKGEFFGIIGRNGSGKSTLLKILAGIYQPDTGKVAISGLISPFLELGIGFNPELSGRDNVYLNATVLGLTQKQIDEKFDKIVAFSELERFIDQKLKNYSSGMQVRLAFSVAIHANRDILLMDEVLAVGDSNFQSKCLEEFNRYKVLGKTVILVTHDTATVQRYCDRAMLLRNGKIMKIGKAEEVATEYIYENMSDEEKRIVNDEKEKLKLDEERVKKMKGAELESEKKRIEDEKKKQEEERKNKVAEITDVKFLDKDGKEKNVFQTGDDITIVVNFKDNQEEKESFDIRISIETEDGYYLFGYDTYSDKFKITRNKERVIFEIENNSFLQGHFFVNVSCLGLHGAKQLDFKYRTGNFKVYSSMNNTLYKGILNLKHSWKD